MNEKFLSYNKDVLILFIFVMNERNQVIWWAIKIMDMTMSLTI